MSNKDLAREPISVDTGVRVSMPVENWQSLRNVYTDKEKALQHVEEGQKHISKLEAKIKELEASSTSIPSLKAEIEEKDARIAQLEKDVTLLTEQVKSTGSISKEGSKKTAAKKAPAKKDK